MTFAAVTILLWLAFVLSYAVWDVSPWIGIPASGIPYAFFAVATFHPSNSWLCPTITRVRGLREKLIALTFDDGPSPTVTPQVLKVLKEKETKATFFVIGRWARRYPETIRSIAEDGHEVANHSYLHPRHVYLWTARTLRRDTELAQRLIKRLVGTVPPVYRPPVGFRSVEMRSVMRSLGLRLVNFSARAFDTQGGSPQQMVDRICRLAAQGRIIMLHDGSDRTPEPDCRAMLTALPLIIERLKSDGYRFVTVSELLNLQAQA
ncbi:MAG: polysaccharide deacetylase family protein [Phycisphaerales bacterium]|nr:MAG: polysaccharide deacetylase family protein [Phycisphaerales bacterium]